MTYVKGIDEIASPENISPTVEFALRLRINGIPLDAEMLQEAMDKLDAADFEVSTMCYQAKCFAAGVQRRMREIQKGFVENPELKVTQAERHYKTDTEHIDLEATLASLTSLADYCEAIHSVITNKYYGLSRQLKGLQAR